MVATSRYLVLLLLLVLSGTAESTQPLTAGDLTSARAFFGADESQPYVLEIGGWRTDDKGNGKPIKAFAYVSLLHPERLLGRLCVVENRWTQGLVIDENVKWTSELFQIHYVVWEPKTTGCDAASRSKIPEQIKLLTMIDGESLLRIMDGREILLEQALEYLPEGERREYSNARLVQLEIDRFKYSASFWSDEHGGIVVYFSETLDGFKIHKAGRYVH